MPMADLIEYPTNKVAPDALPAPGDKYEAFGLAHKLQPPSLVLVFYDWSMHAYPYDGMGMSCFDLLNEDGDCDGECAITLTNGKAPGSGIIAVITGWNVLDLFGHVGDRRVRWIWEFPKDRAAAAKGAPVVRSIDVKEATPSNLAALLK
jgi:hypothetical protein